MLDAFEEILAVPCTSLKIRVDVTPDKTETVSDDEVDEAEKLESLTSLLETVRRVRGYFSGAAAEALDRALRAREAELAEEYEARQRLALEHLAEWEKLLVLFGAGDSSDAHLAEDLVPSAREDLEPAGSIAVDLS